MKKVILSLLCLIGLMAATSNVALADQSQYKKLKISEGRKTYKGLDLPKDTVTKFSRLTWSTNMVEWLWFAPNVGLEIDLKDPTLISCPSIFFQFSYRPGKESFMDRQNFTTNALYYWRARAEYRWHFRMNERQEQRRGLAKTAMWANEKFFTKKIETYVPDTAAINAGDEYATKAVMSKEARIQEKIDSTCNSTNGHKPELFPGRYYLGVYGEYANLTFNNDMLPIFGSNLKDGPLYTVGLSGGYDFPGFNYNHKCFLQWSVGASVGVFWYNYDEYNASSVNKPNAAVPVATNQSKILPFITELKVALNFRNSTITNKYWQPDPAVYTKNIAKNHEDSIHMAELDSVLENNPVVLNVTSINGFDSAFVETVDKNMIVAAFKRSTGLAYLLPTDFNMLEHVEAAIDNKELSDNYFIEYVTTNRLRSYTDSVFISDRKNLPFRLQIAGREEADSLKKSFIDSLKSYFTANNARPIFYGEPATKDSLKGFISKDSIAAQFSRIWGHPMDTSMIRTLYTVRTEAEDDGTTTTYYDSIITEQQINRKERYAMFIQFHPQVTLSGEDEGVGRFSVAMAGADRARELFIRTGAFINKMAKAGLMLRIQRPWNGKGDTFENRVTKEEVFAALQNYGLDSVPADVISIYDSIYAYNSSKNRDTITFDFGVTENPLYYPFIVDDSIGKAKAQALYNDTIKPWREEQYWDPRMGLYDDDPKVPAYYDSITDEWFATTENFINAVKDITFADLKPYMVDSLLYRVNAKPYKTGQLAGKFRAQARVIFHREMVNGKGDIFALTIPYLLVPTETKEDAGWVPPVDSAAILKAQADSLFALTHTITTRDSIAYVLDSLGNVLDSTIIQVTDTIDNAAAAAAAALNDSLTAEAGAVRGAFGTVEEVVDTVKIITVEEATEASNAAAALAKQTAAESKAATAAAKKAKAAATKAQKTAAANIKKAEKSVKLPETMKVTRDSIVAQLDSIGQPLVDSLGNAVVDTLKIEEEVPFEMDSVTTALVATRDSIIAAEQAAAEQAVQYADSLQAIADQAKVTADEAKAAAAEAKKGIAEAKKAAKERAAAEKQKAKEEAEAAKAAAKAEAERAKETVVESVESATAPATSDTSNNNNSATTEAAPLRTQFTEAATQAEEVVEENKAMTVAEATEASNAAATLAKEAAAESKAAAAEAKKAQADATKAAKAAAAALKKVPATAEGEEPTEEAVAAQQVADSLQNVANLAQQVADSLQTVVTDAVQKMNDTKAAAAEAKKAIAEAKKAEKAKAAAEKQKAKEQAAAAKAAAKAEADAAKAAAKAEAEAAKAAAKEEAEAAKAEAETKVEETTEAVTETATEAVQAAAETVEAAAGEAEMTEAEKKAAAKAAAAEAKQKAKEEAAAAKAAAKAEAAAKKAAAAEAKKKAKEEAAAAKAAAKAEAEAAKLKAKEEAAAAKAAEEAAKAEATEESTETKE